MWWITAGCLLAKGIWTHLKATRALVDIWQASETSHSKSSQGNFQHQYWPEVLVNVYSYCLMVKSVSRCCVRGRRLFFNPVTHIYIYIYIYIYICILYGSKFLWDNIFVNFGIALCIMIILALKFLVLYRCSPANISRQCQRTPHRHLLENLPQCIASAWSIINTHNSVSIPFDPVYLRVYNYVVGFSDRN